jgi:hypothetical protein
MGRRHQEVVMPGAKNLRRLSRASVVVAVVAAALATAGSAAPPPPPPPFSALFEDTNPNVTGTCDLTGTSTINFTASGVAVGTYPGPYTETGTITLGPQPAIGSQVLLTTFQSTFTINSPVGRVTGTKELHPVFGGSGLCYDFQFGSLFLDSRIASGLLRYEAVIETPDGRRFRDRGESTFNLTDVDSPPADAVHFFDEGFQSDLSAPEPIRPGKGCGDKNREHEREGECKKTPR